MRRSQEEGPSVAHHRYWSRVWTELDAHRLTQDEAFDAMGHAARVAIQRHPGTYLAGTADDVRRTVGDLASTSPGDWEGFDYHAYLHAQLRAARVGLPPDFVAWGLVQLGLVLGVAWLVVTLYGAAALALPFAADERVRAAGCAFLVTWLVAAVTTSLGHGSLWRYSAGLAPLIWLAGLAGAWQVWLFVRMRG